MKVLNNQTISFLMTYEYNTNLVICQIILYLIFKDLLLLKYLEVNFETKNGEICNQVLPYGSSVLDERVGGEDVTMQHMTRGGRMTADGGRGGGR